MKVKPLANDVSFKTFFLEYPDILARYVCCLFGLKYDDTVTNLKVLNSELVRKSIGEKGKRCDIILELNKYLVVNIEMNSFIYNGLNERNISYIFDIYTSRLKEGEEYLKYLKYKIIQLDLNMSSSYRDPISKFSVQNNIGESYLHDTFYIVSVDIDKCKKLLYNNNNLDIRYRFAAALVATDTETISKLLGDDFLPMEEKEKFIKTIKEKNDDALWQDIYERHNDPRIDEAIMATKIEQAEEKGIEKGIAEKEIEVIKAMLKENINDDIISKVTGKTIEEINKIKGTMID